VSNELKSIWKESIVPNRKKYSPRICLKELRKTANLSGRVPGGPVEMQTEHIPNRCLECYRYTNLFGLPVLGTQRSHLRSLGLDANLL
jgi:hypothetical protein